MKALVVFDSQYGNTETVARAVAAALASSAARALRPAEVKPSDLTGLGLLEVGSPVQGGRPTQAVQEFLDSLEAGALEGVRVAAFDTRVRNFIARLFPTAANRILEELVRRGGVKAGEPLGVLVKGTKGPLLEGELERVEAWSKALGA